jgi:CheY-like chemotaxis protein
MTKTKASPRPKILIVDDDRNILQVFTIRLSAYGATVVTVVTAENGMNGFTIALTEMPDVIVTDYTMPGGSGEYLLGRLKREPETKDIPVIVLTGHTFESKEDVALKRNLTGRGGAAAYLNKPVDLYLFLAELQKHVSLCLEL